MLLESGVLRYWFSLEYGTWGASYGVSQWKPEVITGVADPVSASRFALNEPYPNPCNPGTTIRYELPESKDVRLSVYDMIGREVSVLVDQRKDAGVYEVRFDAPDLASGVYFARLTADNFTQTRKVLVLR